MTNLPAIQQQALTQREWSPAQLTLLKAELAPGLTDSEFKTYLVVADHKGLDPFKRQIYAIKYGGKVAYVTGIDGYRATAERTKEHGGTVYAGQDMPTWGPDDRDGHPQWAEVTVYRIVQGIRVPFPARAWWRDYDKAQRTNTIWKESPHNQLAVRAETIALRKGFPEGLSDLGLAEDYGRVINQQTGEIIEIAPSVAPQQASGPSPHAEALMPHQQASSGFPDDSVMVVCPCGVRWGAEKSGFGGNMTCGHPTDKKTEDNPPKTIFHNRDKVLAELLKRAITDSGLPLDAATDLIKDRFDGLTASKLSDIQRYEAIGMFEAFKGIGGQHDHTTDNLSQRTEEDSSTA